MTLKEFDDYILSFNKEPGHYTDDELYEIGLTHKTLSKPERDWSALAITLGVDRSGEGFRAWVNRRQYDENSRYNFTKQENKFLSCIEEEEENNGKNGYIDYLKNKQKVKDSFNSYRRKIREESRVESFVESIQKVASEMKDLPMITFTSTDKQEDKEAILMFSDLHIGVECDNYYNKYNLEIAKERISKLVDKTIQYCKQNKVKKLNFLNMGDLVHGIIHTNARLEEELDITEQIMSAAELLAETLNQLQKAAPVVTYRSVFDNHSRAVANKNEHIEQENFSRIIDWFVKERLKKSKIVFLDNEIDGGIGNFKLDNGKNVVFAHGHQDNKNTSMQTMIGLTREWVDYILLAHFHSSCTKEFQGCKVIINGSIVGTEQYAFGKRLFSKPSQKLLIFNGTDDDIVDININLE